eukprot:15041635-Ditylum_brightwellii.AAC.1
MKNNDWYFQRKTTLEAELDGLKKIAQDKLRAASVAREAEFSACVERRVTENEVKKMEECVADAETILNRKQNEMSKYRSEAIRESEKTLLSVEEALEGKRQVE